MIYEAGYSLQRQHFDLQYRQCLDNSLIATHGTHRHRPTQRRQEAYLACPQGARRPDAKSNTRPTLNLIHNASADNDEAEDALRSEGQGRPPGKGNLFALFT